MLDTPQIVQTATMPTAIIHVTVPRSEIQSVMGPRSRPRTGDLAHVAGYLKGERGRGGRYQRPRCSTCKADEHTGKRESRETDHDVEQGRVVAWPARKKATFTEVVRSGCELHRHGGRGSVRGFGRDLEGGQTAERGGCRGLP
jgi:hypothetical protein